MLTYVAIRNTRVHEHVFLVRTWKEADVANNAQWRASVTHVKSGERYYFTDYEELQRFLDRWNT